MYCPNHFKMPESAYADFIRHYPLATLFDKQSGEVSQCPLIYDAQQGRLMGHLAIGNPFLNGCEPGHEVIALFHGPQGYISANWYDELAHAKDPNTFQHREVPTWNYSSLEVLSSIKILDKSDTLAVLARQTKVFEQQVGEDWSLDKLSDRQKQAMINAITAFELDIIQWQGKQKLSQNKSSPLRSSLLQHIAEQSTSSYQQLMQDMSPSD